MISQQIIILIAGLIIGIFVICIICNNKTKSSETISKETDNTETKLKNNTNSKKYTKDVSEDYTENNKSEYESLLDNIMTKLPKSIVDIINQIGNSKPTHAQISALEKTLKELIPNPKKLIEEINAAPKDKHGKPIVEKEKLELYTLLYIITISSMSKKYKEEVGDDIATSYNPLND